MYAAPTVASYQLTQGNYTSAGGATSRNAAAPAGIQVGDILVICGSIALNTDDSAEVPSFQKIAYENGSANAVGAFAYWKVAEASDIDQAVPVTLKTTTVSTGYIFYYLRIAGGRTLDNFNSSARNSTGTTHTVQETGSSYSDGLAIGVCGIQDDNTNPAVTGNPGWTEIDNASQTGSAANRSTCCLIAQRVAPAGATTDLIVTTTSAEYSSHIQLVISSIDAPPPLAVEGPEDVYIGEGSDAVFKVTAQGNPPLSYQWYDDGDNPIVGETSDTYTFENVQSADEGKGFYCEVSDQTAPVPLQSRTATIAQVGNPGYEGNAYYEAVKALNPTMYWTMDRLGDVTGFPLDESGNGNDCTAIDDVQFGENPLIDDGGASCLVQNNLGQSWLAVENAPQLIPQVFTVSAIVRPVGAYKTAYLYAPNSGAGNSVARYAMGCDDSASANLGDVWATALLEGDSVETEHREFNVVPTMPPSEERCVAQVQTISFDGSTIRWYADFQLVATHTWQKQASYETPGPSEDVAFLGRIGLTGGLEGYAQHLWFMDRVMDENERSALQRAYLKSCAQYQQPQVKTGPREALVWSFEDDVYTWRDTGSDNGTSIDGAIAMRYMFDPGWQTRWSDLDDDGTTWEDLQVAGTRWSDFYGHGEERNFYEMPANGMYKADQFIKTNGVKEYFVERKHIDLDDVVDAWTTNSFKHLRKFYFHCQSPGLTGTDANPFTFQFGWSQNLMDDPSWGPVQSINMQKTANSGVWKVDLRETGRYLAMKIDFSATAQFAFTGGDMDMEEAHGR